MTSTYSAAAAAGQALLACEFKVARVPPPLAIAQTLERDRVYKSARDGFLYEWSMAGPRPDGLWGQLLVSFDTEEHAVAFSSWLDRYALDGTLFWNREDFAGHQCHVYEVLGSEDRPPAADTQVDVREERFTVAAGTTRDQLRAWFEQVRSASHRRGDTSVMLLYSEAEHLASLVSFGAVPRPERGLLAPPPIGARAPYLPPQAGTLDWSAWVISIFFPFEPGDHGKPSLWPIPGIEPSRGDGVCEVSRHESWHDDPTDCPRFCGNGVQDPDEDWRNCPGDVPLP